MKYQDIHYLAVSGGTLSGLGKGTAMSNIGIVMKSMGWNVTAVKIDPYLNTDAGTMSPYEHGEIYVLADGGEVDLDLGNYERLLDITLTQDHNITSGKVFKSVIERERRGDYLGKTVQLVPHVTDAVQEWIQRVAESSVEVDKPNICMIEVGGTVGDIESSVYLEALQQFSARRQLNLFCMFHLAYVPRLGLNDQTEFKTKPTQHSVRVLRQSGLNPDFILCRSATALDEKTRFKISMTCHIDVDHVISIYDVTNQYEISSILQSQNLSELLCQKFCLAPRVRLLKEMDGYVERFERWMALLDRATEKNKKVHIGIVGKYARSVDTYRSIIEALEHAATMFEHCLKIIWIDAEQLEHTKNNESCYDVMSDCDGILCPGGFGNRGSMGKIIAAKYCRTRKLPYFGICLGLQIAVIEFARNVLNMPHADSEEFSASADPKVIIYMPEMNPYYLGGTMRLGSRVTHIRNTTSLASRIYDRQSTCTERHRHRYEVNPLFIDLYEEHGFIFTGRDKEGQRMEIAELEGHPFYFCTQFHPEFTSRPGRPNPCFSAFIQAAIDESVKSTF